MSMEGWAPGQSAAEALDELMRIFAIHLPFVLGVDEMISACEVIDTDPAGTGLIPRYMTVRIKEYYQDVLWRGAPTLAVGDYVTVAHFREGERYEIIAPSGSSGSSTSMALPYAMVYEGDVVTHDGEIVWR